MQEEPIRIGLIGDNIAASQAPRLHRLAGRQNHRRVVYDRLIPAAMGKPFDVILADCAAAGYRGVNITYPYKERVADLVRIDDPLVRAIGAVNTVLFDTDGMRGFNTDHSGFISAYRHCRGQTAPGPVLMVGAGGVGRAIGFAILALGAAEIRIIDRDEQKARALCRDLAQMAPEGVRATPLADAAVAAKGASGLINCTPVGMVGYPGTALPQAALAGAKWAFDAVYTPVETEFLCMAGAAGLDVISGYELFIGQGVDAWHLFTALPLNVPRLRRDLATAPAEDTD